MYVSVKGPVRFKYFQLVLNSVFPTQEMRFAIYTCNKVISFISRSKNITDTTTTKIKWNISFNYSVLY